MSAFLGIFCPSGNVPITVFKQMVKGMAGPHLDVPVEQSDENNRLIFGHFAQSCAEDYSIDNQPLWNENHSLLINGHFRLDYKEELMRKMGIEVKEFDHLSSSYLVLRAFEKWGPNCVQHIEGDWPLPYTTNKKTTFFLRRIA